MCAPTSRSSVRLAPRRSSAVMVRHRAARRDDRFAQRPGIMNTRVEPLLSVIVPVYNESQTISAVLDRLLSIDLPVPREIIAVNDGSRDGTAAALDAAAARSPLITVAHLPQNGGKGRALRTGLARTRGSIVAIQDADLELDPAQIAD